MADGERVIARPGNLAETGAGVRLKVGCDGDVFVLPAG